MALPTCQCVKSLPPYDRLTAIYQAAAELADDPSLPGERCVAGVPPFQRFAYIYAAFRVLANDNTLPSMECVEGEPPQDQVSRIYQAVYAFANDNSLATYVCVRGLPLWRQWVEIYRALYVAAGSPDTLTNPRCVPPTFDVLSEVFCALLVQSIAPELLSATIDGTLVTLVFDQAVTGNTGFSLFFNGAPEVFTYSSGDGTDTLIFNSDNSAEVGFVVTLDYSPGDVLGANGEPLEAFTNFEVDNLAGYLYFRPAGIDLYLQPDGTSLYVRP